MEKRHFYIAKIDSETDKKRPSNEETPQENKKYTSEKFVSPFYGHKVKDQAVYPFVKFGNKGSQYEGLRDRRLMTDDELKQKYGTKFYEFTSTIQKNDDDIKDTEYFQKEEFTISKNEIARDYRYEKEKPLHEEKNDSKPLNNEDFHKLSDGYDEDYDFFSNKMFSSTNYKNQEEPLYKNGNEEPEEIYRPKEVKPINYENQKSNFNSNDYGYKNSNSKNGYDNKSYEVKRNKPRQKYVSPPLSLLRKGPVVKTTDMTGVNYQKDIIDKTLRDFRIGGRVVHYIKGPTVTQFEIRLEDGVKVERVKNISKNLQMNLEGKSIRIEAPIPGKNTIGIEVPNLVQDKVFFGELMSHQEFLNDNNPLNAVLGIDISGQFVNLDITSMPHALIAGTTGSGKSVCINSIICSILYKAHPDDVKLVLIDPKLIEFSNYEDIPHLATPVINDPKLATAALKWAVDEMQNRYELFKACKRRDFKSYNDFAKDDHSLSPIPYIVIIIDELADLMFIAASSVEEYIQRLAQKARAAGIHLIMATQRPSTDVIKGTIKANMQTRVAFAVNSQVDSMTILDKVGADKLLGKGDMLYSDGVSEIRVQGAYISLEEIISITDYVKDSYSPNFMFSKEELAQKMNREEQEELDPREDEYFNVIARFVVESENASINRIQKKFGIGFNRAQSIMNGLEEMGIVSEGLSGRPRRVLITIDELDDTLDD